MTSGKETYYRNIYGNEHIVDCDDMSLIISQRECYKVSKELAELIVLLPLEGPLRIYKEILEDEGIENSNQIMEKLIALDILSECHYKPRMDRVIDAGKRLLNPNISIVSPGALNYLSKRIEFNIECKSHNKQNNCLKIMLLVLFIVLVAGSFIGTFSYGAVHVDNQFQSSLKMILLVLLGMFCHELGHSVMCMYCGIGFRPIGLTILLIYPVLYTNVSGIEALNFRQRLMVNVAGLFAQSLYMIILLIGFLVGHEAVYLYADKLLMFLFYLNLHPFIRTDGYWMMKDGLDALKEKPLASQIEGVFDLIYGLFSFYLMYKLYWIVKRLLGYFLHNKSILFDVEFFFNMFLLYLSVLLIKAIFYRLKDLKNNYKKRYV